MRDVLQGTLDYLEGHEDSLTVRALAVPLLALSWCYGMALKLRWTLQEFGKSVRVPCATISVGNITVGGTGKTPMVAWVAGFLNQRGSRVAVVSHGYGARAGGAYVLLKEQEPSADISSVAGDEAVLLSHMLGAIPVASGRKKASSLVKTWRRLRPDVIVLDDAFQSIHIRKDLEIVVVDATNPWGSGHLLPRGRLREPKQNISRGDIIILTRCNQADDTSELESEIRKLTPAPIVRAYHALRGAWRIDTWEEIRLDALKNARVYAFSAVANPASFEKTLEEAGVEMVGFRRFVDHHFFSREDLEEIGRETSQARVEFLVTTEKDAMRLSMGAGTPRLGTPLLAVGIRLEIVGESEALEDSLMRLAAAGAR
jgi:tetraacyldisaccharide 4'-kinase